MTYPFSAKKLKYLILARMRFKKKPRRMEMDKVRNSLYAYVALFFTKDEWRNCFDELIKQLQHSGRIIGDELSPSGIEDLSHFVGDKTATGWRMYKRVHFPALALAIQSPIDKVARRFRYRQDGLLACVIARKNNFNFGDLPTCNAVMDALVWSYLGVDIDTPLTVERIRQVILARMVGAECTFTASNYAHLKRLYAAQVLGIRGANIHAIQRQLVTEWLRASADDNRPEGSEDG